MNEMTGKEALQTRIHRLGPWFHNLHLPNGVQTAPDHPLGDFPACKWRQIESYIPADLTGWTALDIGCNAGFYSFELARRGARVTALDLDERYLRQARWAARQYGLADSITFRLRQVYSLAASKECYDLVLFMGVFYHLRYPLLALDTIYWLRPQLLIFQTLTTGDETQLPMAGANLDFDTRHWLNAQGWPKLSFIENSFWNDPTNWWVPNHAGVMALLRSAGFVVKARPAQEMYICAPAKAGPANGVETEWRAAAQGAPRRSMRARPLRDARLEDSAD